MVAALLAGDAFAQDPVAPKEPARCASVVMVRCEPESAPPAPERDRARRLIEHRRAGFDDPFELERIVIEADPLGRSITEAMAAPFAARSPNGAYSYSMSDGTYCTCMDRCLPFVPCCQCSVPPRGYLAAPGSRILN